MAESAASNKKYVQQLQKEFDNFQSAPKYSLDSEELFCTCRKPDNGELMVACDGCDEWFHFKCMGLDEKNKDLVRNFYCRFCDVLFGKGKSVWKRKCKLTDCHKPINGESQFCSQEHGNIYWRDFLKKFDLSTAGHMDNEHDATEFISRLQAENLIQSLCSREELLELGNKLPVYDKGPLKITASQRTEIDKNKADMEALTEETENLKFKLEYLLKLKDILSHLNELLTISMNPENQSRMEVDSTAEEAVAESVEKKKKKTRSNKKVKKFKIDICGFDQRILLDEKAWADFKKGTECKDIMSFEKISPEEEGLIINKYQTMKSSATPATDDSTVLSRLCITDKRKCHLHNGWYNIIKDGLELKINENLAKIERKTRENEDLEKFIQVKNWKLYCNEQ